MKLAEVVTNSPNLWFAATVDQNHRAEATEGNETSLRPPSLRILIVEDEFYISLHLSDLVQSLGHIVVATAVSADEAVSRAEQERPDLVLMDIRLLGTRDGIDAAEEIRGRFGIGSIFITANTDQQTRQRAEGTRPLGYLEKPITQERLRQGLSRIAPKR